MTKAILSTLLLCSVTASVAAQAPRPAATAPQPAPATLATEVPDDYLIGAEDVLGVVFWREDNISGDVTVRPDGRITLPVIGEMVAAGLRPAALQAQITTAATKYLTDPNVAVVVRVINSRRIFVTGRVTTPGAHLLKGPLNVLQAIAMSGGLTEYADAKNIAVLRDVNGRTERFAFNYKDVAKGKHIEQNITLRPGDTVVVP